MVGEGLTQRYLESMRVGVLKVEGGGGGVHTKRYLNSMRVGVLMLEGGGGGVHTDIFGQYEGRSTQG